MLGEIFYELNAVACTKNNFAQIDAMWSLKLVRTVSAVGEWCTLNTLYT